MRTPSAKRTTAAVTTVAILASLLISPAAGASVTRTSGTGYNVSTSWVEYDLEDRLGLPGNTHVGYLGIWISQWGTHFYGNVIDWECEEGEVPWGGHGEGGEVVVDDADKIAEVAAEIAVDDIIDSGAKTIDADIVVDAIKDELAREVPALIEEEVDEEFPVCDHKGIRFLDGYDNDGKLMTNVSVDVKKKIAKVTGNLVVRGGHGGGGDEPLADVLGTPPIDLTISGGDWYKYEWSYTSQSKDFKYSDWNKGTDYYGGKVSGKIGAMGFDDDPDDESWGGFGSFQYKTVERVRN
ncbi:MAG: hypothetical protein KJO36_00440 [Acidimicrobiia bacterium]|nr:hypothetical protein [Acidimicrobiia bacterium]NNL47360.1 hypothetical protein [Acidimicrobiia bacterium]